MMDEGASSSMATADMDKPADKSDETEDQLALVPKHFFRKNPKPGMKETVEVVNVYESEVAVKCLYGEDDKPEADSDEPDFETTENEPTDAMYE